MSHFYLIGLPGSGKSAVGSVLAHLLNLPFIDLDKVIEKNAGKLIKSIFDKSGETHFREIESQTLKKISTTQSPSVISCGGGTPCFLDNLQVMQSTGKIFYLAASVETIAGRILSTTDRPLLNGSTNMITKLTELKSQREQFYKQADHHITVDKEATPKQIADNILGFIKN